MNQVLIIANSPSENLDEVLSAIAEAGGGVVGEYTHCSFSHEGTGRFKPNASANPHVGEPHTVNTVEEIRIETFCDYRKARSVIQAIRSAHPYEEPVIYVVPLLDENELP